MFFTVPVFWSGEDRVCFLFGVIVVVDTGRVVFFVDELKRSSYQ
jgi:hypothetical protein